MPQDIQHMVVLMMENRSFDHLLGYIADVNGLTGKEWNPLDPAHPTNKVLVTPTADYILNPDPGHSFSDVNVQLFDNPSGPPPTAEPNWGFVYSYSQQPNVTPQIAPTIMRSFETSKIPVLTTLATEFAVCDSWFSSVPGPTWPNRFFVHAATSKGYLDNSQFHNYDMRSIFENLSAQGLTWKDYYHDFSQTWALQRLQTPELKVNFASFGQFQKDARSGKLPNYSFIEPKYFSFLGAANDQHPPHDVRAGETLIAQVYNSLRESPAWEKTLLVILYDEHGGTYDHVQPPENATPPDAFTSQFGFDRYGVRVPAILISPFIPKMTDRRVFDHSSVPATVKHVFGLHTFLTRRDANANIFSDVASLAQPRTDVPARVGAFEGFESEGVQTSLLTPEMVLREKMKRGLSSAPLSDFQQDLVQLADVLPTDEPSHIRALRLGRRIETEYDAAIYVREVADKFMSSTNARSN